MTGDTAAGDRPRPRVLLVDDDERLLQGVCRALRPRVEVRTARDGAEGLRILEQEGPFCAVVSDYRMPGTDGIAFLGAAGAVAPDSVRILLSGAMHLKVAIEAVNHGRVSAILRKPCPPDELSAALEEAARRYEARIAERRSAATAKESFLATVSHELRTPITSIRAAAEVLLEHGEREGPRLRREFTTIVREEACRLERLVSSILQLARTDSEPLRLAPVDGVELLRAAARTVPRRGAKNVRAEFDLPDRPLLLLADGARIQEALEHVVDNAFRAAPADSAITFRARRSGDGIELGVRDRGPGVEDEHRVFEPFYQAPDVLTGKPPGAGLGLTLARRIVERHGGRIECRNAPEGGAEFVLRLPAAPAA